MKLNKILALTLSLVLLLGTFSVLTTPAYAAASFNGFIHSGGRSAVSYRAAYPLAYQYRLQDRYYQDRDEYLRAFIAHLQNLIAQLEQRIDDNGDDDNNDISVTTLSAISVDDEGATLRGRVYTDDEDEVTLYFEYGDSSNDLDEETAHKVIEDPTSTYTFTTNLSGLDDDTQYYYRAVAEDEDGDEDYGSVVSFYTDNYSSSYDEPTLDTESATNITDESAELRGEVDMNEFNDGLVFFIYGEDEDQIADVENDYDSYSDIDEDEENLQKEQVDSDLDDSESYAEVINGLDNDTEIYHRICVEYEDEDDDNVLACGDTDSFTTDD